MSLLFILASVLTILYIIDTRDTVLTLKEGSVLAPLPPLYICPNKQMSLAQRGSVEKLLPVMKDLWVVWDRLTLGEDPMEFLLPWGNDSKAVEEMREVMYNCTRIFTNNHHHQYSIIIIDILMISIINITITITR